MASEPPPPEEAQWYYMSGPNKLGPVTIHTMLQMIQTGAVTASTMVWREGMSAWSPASALPEFSYALSSAKGDEAALGLTTAGLVIFIVLLLTCLPLCWLPWVIDSLQARKR